VLRRQVFLLLMYETEVGARYFGARCWDSNIQDLSITASPTGSATMVDFELSTLRCREAHLPGNSSDLAGGMTILAGVHFVFGSDSEDLHTRNK
jgi:hypothetical protein